MKVVGRWDEKGNPIFEVKSKRISFDMDLLRRLVKRNISIVNLYGKLLGQARKDGTVGLNFLAIVSWRENDHSIKKEIVSTLVHEVRHVLQLESGDKGIYKLIQRWMPYWGSILGVVICVIVVSDFYFFHLFSPVFLILILILDAVMFSDGPFLIYYFSPDERDARAFAKKALKDEEWLKVVKVEDKDTP